MPESSTQGTQAPDHATNAKQHAKPLPETACSASPDDGGGGGCGTPDSAAADGGELPADDKGAST